MIIKPPHYTLIFYPKTCS